MTVCRYCGQAEGHWAGCPGLACQRCRGGGLLAHGPRDDDPYPCSDCRRESVPARPNMVRALCARCEWVGEYRETQGDADDDARAHALGAHLERVPL